VPKWHSRAKGAFGDLLKSPTQLRNELEACFKHARLVASRTNDRSIGSKNRKRLRSRIAHAMALDVVYQPVGWVRKDGKGQGTWSRNPIWDLAPKGAYYKSKRFCSLLNDLAVYGRFARLSHDLMRLSMYIWTMSQSSFDGLCRRIRSKIFRAVRSSSTSVVEDNLRPESTEGLGPLTVNPPYGRVDLRTRRKYMGCKTHEARSLWLSVKLDTVRIAHRQCCLGSYRSSG
jgi:hypothetical protein